MIQQVDAAGDFLKGAAQFEVGPPEDLAAGFAELGDRVGKGGLNDLLVGIKPVLEHLAGLPEHSGRLVEIDEEGLVGTGKGGDELGNALGLVHQSVGGEVTAVVEFRQEFLGAKGVDEGEGFVLLLLHGR